MCVWSCVRMNHAVCLFLAFIAGSAVSLRLLDPNQDCTQAGLEKCKVYNCSKVSVNRSNVRVPGPLWGPVLVGEGIDQHGTVPVMNVTWEIQSNAGVHHIRGSVINVVDKSTNQSICLQFSYRLNSQVNPDAQLWAFSLHGVVVEAAGAYTVSVFHLPAPPDFGGFRIEKPVTIPGCVDARVRATRMCLENGSMWEPRVTANTSVAKHRFSTALVFETAEFSDTYQVYLQSYGFRKSVNVSKGVNKFLNVTFEFDSSDLSACEALLIIKPFFIRCQNNCRSHEETIDYCNYFVPRTSLIKGGAGLLAICVIFAFLLWNVFHKDPVSVSPSAAGEQPESFQVSERKKVLIIYSLDHRLYKDVVLKLCAFLKTKCGTEVVLDLLDSSWLGVLGSVQWLDWHQEQIEKSNSNKILILCSPGVQAKWRAMCGEQQVLLREDVRSPLGDTLTPALSLMVPRFVRHASFQKYIVAYFDGICSEDDVPSPFHIAVRYKLMKQFEEVFFRILDTERHRPGRVSHIEGLAEDQYHRCPSGGALRDAIEAFRTYQLQHPQWFQEELLENPDVELERLRERGETVTTHIPYWGPSSARASSHGETQDTDFTVEGARPSMAEQLQVS